MRAGFLTGAAKRGASIFKMMDQSRHRSVETLRGYVRERSTRAPDCSDRKPAINPVHSPSEQHRHISRCSDTSHCITVRAWDRDEGSRVWSKRFFERTGRMPGMVQAGTYSAVLHYLKAMEAAGTVDGRVVADRIRELPVDDFFAKGRVREDGGMMHDMYLVEVKTPSESKAKWDYYKVLRRIPAEEAAQPLSESKCSLVKK
jgi:Periplasmic binding protein